MRLALLSLGVLASLSLAALLAPAASADSSSFTAELNQQRASIGLTPLAEDAAADSTASALAAASELGATDFSDSAPADCDVCSGYIDPSGLEVSLASAYQTAGGTNLPVAVAVNARWRAAVGLASVPWARAALLDPRARTVGSAETAAGALIVVVGIDPAAPFKKTVIWPSSRLDPSKPQLTAIAPPGSGASAALYELRGSSKVQVASLTADESGVAGARVFTLASDSFSLDQVRLAYSSRLQLKARAAVAPLTTIPVPAGFVARSWAFDHFGPYKASFLAAWKKAPPLYRRIVAVLDGAVTVSPFAARRCGGGSVSCASVSIRGYSIDFNRSHLRSLSFEDFIIYHETGHQVEYMGLDSTGYAAFKQAMRHSASWRNCFPAAGGGCVAFDEILADQFAFWATGNSKLRSGYNDPPLIGRAAFARILAQQFAFRPLPGLSPVSPLRPPR